MPSWFLRTGATLGLVAALVATPRPAAARVVRVVIDHREDIAGGRPFGTAGAYERIVGRIFYAFDPANPHDRQIVDLRLAPRNARGEVEAWGDFIMLRPKDPSRASGVALIDVVNRGGMTVGVFHLGADRRASPDDSAFYGDALLLRQGLTIVMVGWQWDVMPGGGRLVFHPPVAGDPTHPITGLVRSDITIDQQTMVIPLGHRVGASEAIGYPVALPNDPANVLTARDSETGPRTVIPRTQWRFARDSSGIVVDDPRHVYLTGGFSPGKIYEVVYRAADPYVVGTGLAAVRDVISWLKYDDSTNAAPRIRWGIAYGVSQTGRFLRHFVYQDFNVDERGRTAFDGVFAHTAGAGRGSFNHRFAQPSRDAQPYSTFFYPTDVFPFTSPIEADPVTGLRDGLLAHADRAHLPRIFYVDGGHEYWGRAASLTHTSADGSTDVGFLPNERRYVISSVQHSSPGAWPPAPGTRLAGTDAYRGDPNDQRLALRALLVSLVGWVKDGAAPPASKYPTLATRTLVAPTAVAFPTIPGLPMARHPHDVFRLDFGQRFRTQEIVDIEPPKLGAPYPVLVSQVDSIGNDLGGIRTVELRVPLATYFPWQLRTGYPAAQDRLVSFQGTFVPLPRTEVERQRTGDTRPSIERLYGSEQVFLSRVDDATRALVAERFLLPDDVPTARARMEDVWHFVHAEGGAR